MDALIAQNRGMHPSPWYKRSDILSLNLLLTACLITSAVNGFDGSTLNGLQSVKPWQEYFNHPAGQRLSLLGCIQSVGSIAAIPFSPFLADGIGRRPTILIGSIIMLGAAILSGAAQNFGMFVAAKGLLGFGLQFAQMASPMLVTELAYPGQRAQLTSIFNSLWYVGAVISAWTIFGTQNISNDWSWRIPSLLQGLPSIFQLTLIWFIPESPRWLVAKGREDQAARILAKYHAKGDINDPLVAFEMSEIKEALAAEAEVARTTSYKDLIRTKGNKKRILLITAISFFSQWSGNGLVSYYMTGILTDVGITSSGLQLLINAILQCFNVVMAVGAAVLVEKIGRRTLFLTSNTGMLLTWSIWTGLAAAYVQYNNVAAGKAVVAVIFVYYGFYDIAYSPLLVAYTVEILPYRIRAKGVAYMNLCVSASLVFNQYANPVARDAIGWKYYLVYVAWLAFELGFVWKFLVETRGLSLEETALLFDGEEGRDNINALSGHAQAKADHEVVSDTQSDVKGDYISEKSA